MDLDNFAKNYLSLGLRINKHINGYVEHYYGPLELKRAIDLEKKFSPRSLLSDCKNLIEKIRDQGFEEKRLNFLHKNLYAIKTILRKLNGENIPYLELVEKLFDFKPVLYDDDFFYDLSIKADKLYHGNGTLPTRIKRYVNKRKIPPKILRSKFIEALKIARKQTQKIFPGLLPDNEKVEVAEVLKQKWQMYCWYLGNFISKIEINIEKIHYWTNLLKYVCHEGYPGHHTERSVKENSLFRDKGYFESAILLIYTPEIVISEGIGVLAESIIFSNGESSKILLENFLPTPKEEDSLEILIGQKEIREGFRKFESNLAYHKYVDGWDDVKLISYTKSFKVIPNEGIKSLLNFISDELWAPYIPVYQGERLITEKYGNQPSPRQFQRLLSEQFLPSDLI